MRRRAWIGWVLAAAVGLALPARGQADDTRRAGDVVSLALPIGTLAVELWRGDRQGAWQLAQTFALTTGMTEVLKETTGVMRPDGSDDKSFPSGHAARAFSAAAYVHRRHGLDHAWPLYLAATWVGHTRVQADRHLWSEVLVSAALAEGFARWRVTRAGARGEVTPADGGLRVGLALPL